MIYEGDEEPAVDKGQGNTHNHIITGCCQSPDDEGSAIDRLLPNTGGDGDALEMLKCDECKTL